MSGETLFASGGAVPPEEPPKNPSINKFENDGLFNQEQVPEEKKRTIGARTVDIAKPPKSWEDPIERQTLKELREEEGGRRMFSPTPAPTSKPEARAERIADTPQPTESVEESEEPNYNPNIPYIDTLRPDDPEYMAWVEKRNKELEDEYYQEHPDEYFKYHPNKTPQPTKGE